MLLSSNEGFSAMPFGQVGFVGRERPVNTHGTRDGREWNRETGAGIRLSTLSGPVCSELRGSTMRT